MNISQIITGISDAQTAILGIIAALLSLAIAMYGAKMVYNYIKSSGNTSVFDEHGDFK